MTPELWLAIGGLFIRSRLLTGLGASALLARTSPERRRLREAAACAGGPACSSIRCRLTESLDPRLEAVASKLPKSPKEMGRLRRRLPAPASTASAPRCSTRCSELVLPVLFAGAVAAR